MRKPSCVRNLRHNSISSQGLTYHNNNIVLAISDISMHFYPLNREGNSMFHNTPTSSHQGMVPPSQPEGSGIPSSSTPVSSLELLEESMTPLPQHPHGAWGWWLRMTAPPQPQSR